MASRGSIPIVGLLVGGLVLAGGGRALSSLARDKAQPDALREVAGDGQKDELGRLDSFALALLLGGLRGPLVMALWSTSDTQRGLGDLDALQTKIELIRLLQPQFDSVHVYQIHNRAYNLSVARANLPSKYEEILGAIKYGNEVLEERPYNINIESQLGKVFSRKLGGSVEMDYFVDRVYEETKPREPRVRVSFPNALESDVRVASRKVGIPTGRLTFRDGDDGQRTLIVSETEANELSASFPGGELTLEALQESPAVLAATVRLPSMLDEGGNLLPELTKPTRNPPEGAKPGEYLDGSQIQFLEEFAPYPEGLSPHALAYEHFRRALVLQEFGGQQHAESTEATLAADPGRALREWAIEAFEIGRKREVEAFGFVAPPRTRDGGTQASVEMQTAKMSPDSPLESRQLAEQALQFYARSSQVGAAAIDWLTRHIERYPASENNLGSSIDRLRDLSVLQAADALYLSFVLDPADPTKLREAADLYRQADGQMLDYVLRYHDDIKAIPQGMSKSQMMSVDRATKEAIYANLRNLRRMTARDPSLYQHVRAFDEFEGFRSRIAMRLSLIEDYLGREQSTAAGDDSAS